MTASAKPIRAIIVEDEPLGRALLRQMLRSEHKFIVKPEDELMFGKLAEVKSLQLPEGPKGIGSCLGFLFQRIAKFTIDQWPRKEANRRDFIVNTAKVLAQQGEAIE